MDREVLEFVIVPPFEQRAAVAAAKDRLIKYLGYRFQGYSFKIGPFVPVGGEEAFSVLPVMNFIGDDGKTYMCNEPSRWLLREIADACREFSLTGLRSYAA